MAFPTDTFFALGAVLSEESLTALFTAKGRMAGNPVPVLLSSAEQANQVTKQLPETAAALADAFWPGPLTLVLPALQHIPHLVTAGTGNVGVRVPDHELARNLISVVGSPVTGTSANLSGNQPCKTAAEVLSQLGGVITAVVDAPCGGHIEPSTVLGFSNGELEFLRSGSIADVEIRRVIGRL